MNNDDVYEEVKRITKPTFDKVLKEIDENLVLVGSETDDKPFFVYIQPHNYRGWYDFEKKNYDPETRVKKLKSRGMLEFKKINYGKEHYFKFEDYHIKVKRSQVEVLNKINKKRWFSIDPFRAKAQVETFMGKMEQVNKEIIRDFIEIVGGHSDFKLLKHTDECKITNSIIIDKIDPDLTYHTKTHKKVYSEPQVEVYNMVDAVQLIENSIFFKYSREIAEPLKAIIKGVSDLKVGAGKPPKNRLSPYDLINTLTKVDDVEKVLPYYLELEWDDRFMVCNHIKELI